ncbi:MAG: hypothetical protein GY791_02175 [Alphaproteobacteria bacterium]|nr:hypothetical protein [Alphaproteobacteria bacterium]
MKRVVWIFCFIFAVVSVTGAAANDRSAITIEGAYLVIQDDGYQRILSLDRGGNITQVSDQQPLIGFTSGKGAWEQTGPDTVTARVVDFAYELDDGEPVGSAVIVYELKFGEPVSGKFETRISRIEP